MSYPTPKDFEEALHGQHTLREALNRSLTLRIRALRSHGSRRDETRKLACVYERAHPALDPIVRASVIAIDREYDPTPRSGGFMTYVLDQLIDCDLDDPLVFFFAEEGFQEEPFHDGITERLTEIAGQELVALLIAYHRGIM